MEALRELFPHADTSVLVTALDASKGDTDRAATLVMGQTPLSPANDRSPAGANGAGQ